MKRLLISLIAACAFSANLAQAQPTAPDVLVKNVSQQILSGLKARQDELTADPDKLYAFVDELVLPHFDFTYMSQLVLGKYWRKASADQRAQFTREFRNLLVKTYSNSLTEYEGQIVEYLPFRMPSDPDEGATVKVEIIPKAGPSIPMDYALHQIDGVWKIYDVSVDGLSLVTNYRRSFGREVDEKGLDALIASLKNRAKGK